MNARNWLVIRTHDGEMLAVVHDLIRAEITRSQNNVGWFSCTASADFDPALLQPDRIVEFWRQPQGGEEKIMGVGLMRKWGWRELQDGREVTYFSGPDQMELLERRIVAYRAGTSQASKNGPADDIIKAIVDENMGPAAGNDSYGRPRYYPSSHFTIAPDEGDGVTVEMSFAWRNVLAVIREIAQASRNQDTPVYFDLEYLGEGVFIFKTWTDVMGIDRTLTAGIAPVVFSKEQGNLASPDLSFDYTEEINHVIGGGPGEGQGRIIDPENDQVREQLTIWNKREAFQDARECPSTGGSLCVANKAFDRMQAGRPRVWFSGRLLDTPQSRFGVDWFYGDKVTIRYHGMEFDGPVAQFRLSWNERGEEQIDARVEITEAIEGKPT